MAKALDDEEILYMKHLYFDKGFSYNQVSRQMERIFGIIISDESVRYQIVRKEKPKFTEVEKLKQDGITKKLILSDLHIPFNIDCILEIVDKHKNEIDEIILNGDIIDCGEISVFQDLGKYKLIEEMISTYEILREIDIMTPDIKKIINFGNHEMRWKRYLANTNTSLNALHSDNILKEICGGFIDHDFQKGTETSYEPLENYIVIDDWWQIVNDIIVCHPISFSKVKARTATQAVDYFVQQGVEFNSIIVGHTHQQSMVNHYDKVAYEQGCLCLPMKYSTSGKLGYTPQINGYMLAVFVDGEFNCNETRVYRL